jgi:Kef-type K+ transport system membrane component KefB
MAAAAALDAAALAAAGIACVAAGRAAQRARLPQITGFLIAGIAAGPAGSGLVSARLLAALAPVEAACLGAIAFAAGAELHLSELQRTRRQVTSQLTLITMGRSHQPRDCIVS